MRYFGTWVHKKNDDFLQGNFNISNTIDGSTTTFTIIYNDSISDEYCSPPIIIPASSCANGICSHVFDVLSSSDCPASTNITTTVFASNILGNGPLSNSATSGHTIYIHSSIVLCMVAINLRSERDIFKLLACITTS